MNKADFDIYRDMIEERIPFHKFLGLKVVSLEKGSCSLLIPFQKDFIGDASRESLHGGVISTIIASCGGFAVYSMCSINDKIVTIDMRVDYLKPAPDRDLVAESRVRLVGSRVGSVHTIVYSADAPDEIVAEGSSVYNIRRAGE